MAQYVYTMNSVAKIVPPKRHILRDISLSFFPGAKIGVLGLNGAGKSTLLRIMGGVDKEFEGEARPAGLASRSATCQQEPELNEGQRCARQRRGRRGRNPRSRHPLQRDLGPLSPNRWTTTR